MARLKLTIAYDGRGFHGWQSQAGRNTIQDNLEEAFHRLTGERIRLHGSGRTDAGVHALGQVAHVDVSDPARTPERWINALNALLPTSIRVLRARYVASTFHARYSARGKTYRYRIWAGSVASPFEEGRAWHISGPFDFALFALALRQFVGKHDFSAFAAKRGQKEENTIRRVHSARTRKSGALLVAEVSGEGFLYKMVRLMVGAAARCAMGKLPLESITERLKSPEIRQSRYVAPASGLYLFRVRY